MTEKKNHSSITIFLDDDPHPLAELISPVSLDIDTRKLTDGQHVLKLISSDSSGREGIRLIPFEVRNGPSISIEGIRENAVVDGLVSVMINAYGKGDQKTFLIEGSETPHSIPGWVWVGMISFIAWAIFYLVSYLNMEI